MPTFSSGPDRAHSEAPLQRVSISLAAAVPLTILALVVSFADMGGAALAAWVVVLALGSGLALAGLGRGAGRDEAASERAARSRARLEASRSEHDLREAERRIAELAQLLADGEARQAEDAQVIADLRGQARTLEQDLARERGERARLEERLERAQVPDLLTGLPDRGAVLERVREALDRLQRRPAWVGILLVDLDDFRGWNERNGSEQADALLCRITEALFGTLRDTDHLARLGGDEFAVLLDHMESPAGAVAAAERIHAALGQLEGDPVGASIGVAFASSGVTDPGLLLARADVAMVRAKERGRGRTEVFRVDMEREPLERAQVQRRLGKALAADEFDLAYLPQVELETGRVCALEALLRLDGRQAAGEGATTGLPLPAGEVVRIADRAGYGPALGRRVLERALEERAHWSGEAAGLPLILNVSSGQWCSSEWLADLLERAAAGDLALVLDVPEAVVMEDVEASIERMHVLAGRGIRIALDDMRNDTPSLPFLARLPVQEIKLDRPLVDALGGDAETTRVVESVVEVARGLGVRLSAEGVEDERAAAHLARLGFERAQGFLFHRPCPADSVPSALEAAALPAPI